MHATFCAHFTFLDLIIVVTLGSKIYDPFRIGEPQIYRVFRAQAEWTFIVPLEFPAKELRHLPRKMPPRGTMYCDV
jgi:hypothetical protein